ncbi:MAG: Cna B-type domain-containing protein [Anaerolineaceae bacterium]
MPFSRRLTIATVSILLLCFLTGGLTQSAFAQTTVTLQANVFWVDGPKPSIQLQLFRSSPITPEQAVPGDTLRTLAPGGSSASWMDMEALDASSNAYTFKVKQGKWNTAKTIFTEAAPASYTGSTEVDGATFTITNTYAIPAAGTFTATKQWVNGADPRPNIAFQLYRKTSAMPEAEPVPEGQIILLEGATTANWVGLEETDINGLPYRFTVREMHYDVTVSDFVNGPPANYSDAVTYSEDLLSAFVTNTFTSELVNITATKNWTGGTTPRPTVAFRLYRATALTTRQPLADSFIKELLPGDSTIIWTSLEAKDSSANLYIYSVVECTWNITNTTCTEGPPPEYKASYSADGLTVTNTYSPTPPPENTITATKNWVNGPAAKPTIWFKLYRQVVGDTVEEVPVAEAPIRELPSGTESVSWQIQNLKDPNGKEYTFTVREVNAQGQNFVPATYTKSEAGLAVTNTYVIPLTATANATKTWTQGPTVKPTIGFRLYRTSATITTQVVPGVEVKDLPNGTTQVGWTGLEATDLAGNPYTFSVHEGTWNTGHTQFNEGAPTNYQKTENGLTVNNAYVSPKINIIGTKIWSGGPAAKPNIQIQLYRNGAIMGNPYTLTSGITSYTWYNVDQTDQNGATYQYTINEVTVPAYYSKSVNGMTVTNTYTGTLPYTGDNTHNARWLALLLGLAAILPLAHWLDLKLLTSRRG